MSAGDAPEAPEPQATWRIPLELRRRLLEALTEDSMPPAPGGMSYEEFLDWLDEDTVAEWVRGEVIVPSPVTYQHQDIADFLVSVLRQFAETGQLGTVISAPFQLKLPESGREPDVIFVSAAHGDRIKPTYLDGPADLAVEVISPESVGRDRGDKFYEYEAARVPEYWLIDPRTRRAEFYQLDAQSAYQLAPTDADGVYHSAAVPGFWLRVSWLWQQPPPPVVDVLLEVGGEAYARDLIERLRRRGYLPEP
jgi:Uma2 family endonuclease